MSKIINAGPLAFYDSEAKQHHKKTYAYNQMWPLIVKLGTIPSFQFMGHPSFAAENGEPIPFIALSRIDTNGKVLWVEYLHELIKDYVAMIGHETYTTFMSFDQEEYNLQNAGLSHKIEDGCYFLIIEDALRNRYTSDVFTYCSDVSSAIKIEYSNSYNFRIEDKEILLDGKIRPFTPVIYIDSQLGRPEYRFEEEVVSRLGYEFIESQVSKKVYKFNFVATEYLLDAMRLIRLCDTKKCTFKDEEYKMLVFNLEATWGEQGDLATVEASFEVDNIIANLGGLITM